MQMFLQDKVRILLGFYSRREVTDSISPPLPRSTSFFLRFVAVRPPPVLLLAAQVLRLLQRYHLWYVSLGPRCLPARHPPFLALFLTSLRPRKRRSPHANDRVLHLVRSARSGYEHDRRPGVYDSDPLVWRVRRPFLLSSFPSFFSFLPFSPTLPAGTCADRSRPTASSSTTSSPRSTASPRSSSPFSSLRCASSSRVGTTSVSGSCGRRRVGGALCEAAVLWSEHWGMGSVVFFSS